MLERLKDVNLSVQLETIQVIHYLQEPENRHCNITKALLLLMRCDPHWQVRQQAMQRVVISGQTLAHIVDRVRDANVNVRSHSSG